MKTTIRCHTKDLIVRPSPVAGMVELNLVSRGWHGGPALGEVLTADQCGTLMFALECALEAQETPKAQADAQFWGGEA